MNNPNTLQEILGQTDIYLADQIMKGRYQVDDKILDAGCGSGRNMYWFLQNHFNIFGIDNNEEAINSLKNKNPGLPAENFRVSVIENTPFPDDFFDHIICNAVFHFANNTVEFYKMMGEMVRVLKPGGSLFFRMTSDIGIENNIEQINDGVYLIPDGSKRFLLTRSLLASCLQQNNLLLIEPLKTVNVDDMRCMSTVVLQKY